MHYEKSELLTTAGPDAGLEQVISKYSQVIAYNASGPAVLAYTESDADGTNGVVGVALKAGDGVVGISHSSLGSAAGVSGTANEGGAGVLGYSKLK